MVDEYSNANNESFNDNTERENISEEEKYDRDVFGIIPIKKLREAIESYQGKINPLFVARLQGEYCPEGYHKLYRKIRLHRFNGSVFSKVSGIQGEELTYYPALYRLKIGQVKPTISITRCVVEKNSNNPVILLRIQNEADSHLCLGIEGVDIKTCSYALHIDIQNGDIFHEHLGSDWQVVLGGISGIRAICKRLKDAGVTDEQIERSFGNVRKSDSASVERPYWEGYAYLLPYYIVRDLKENGLFEKDSLRLKENAMGEIVHEKDRVRFVIRDDESGKIFVYTETKDRQVTKVEVDFEDKRVVKAIISELDDVDEKERIFQVSDSYYIFAKYNGIFVEQPGKAIVDARSGRVTSFLPDKAEEPVIHTLFSDTKQEEIDRKEETQDNRIIAGIIDTAEYYTVAQCGVSNGIIRESKPIFVLDEAEEFRTPFEIGIEAMLFYIAVIDNPDITRKEFETMIAEALGELQELKDNEAKKDNMSDSGNIQKACDVTQNAISAENETGGDASYEVTNGGIYKPFSGGSADVKRLRDIIFYKIKSATKNEKVEQMGKTEEVSKKENIRTKRSRKWRERNKRYKKKRV